MSAVAAIIRKCLDGGLNLQTWTPVSSISGSDDDWTVHTSRGEVRTPTILHATNAFASGLLPEFVGLVIPTPHMCNRVYPPADFIGGRTLQNSYGVLYKDGLYTLNPRSTSDGVLLVGGSPPNIRRLREHVSKDPRRSTDDSLVDFEPVTADVRSLGTTAFRW